jgi:hypothetical protein
MSSCTVPGIRHILTKLELSRPIFEKTLHVKFYKNPSNGNRVVPCVQIEGQPGGRTEVDMTKLRVVFHSFANAS